MIAFIIYIVTSVIVLAWFNDLHAIAKLFILGFIGAVVALSYVFPIVALVVGTCAVLAVFFLGE